MLASYLFLLLIKVAFSWYYAARHREVQTEDQPVTILQPILSGDPFLEEDLRHNINTVTGQVQFLWLVDEDDAEGRRITELLTNETHGKVTVLLCPPLSETVNPKTFKLQLGLQEVNTEYVAVLDDDTRLDVDNIGKAIYCLHSCDLYTGLPIYSPGKGLWSALVAQFVNNNNIMTYLPLLPLTEPLSLNGMFYVIRTSGLRDLGGFSSIQTKLCDDYALAKLVTSSGGKIRQGITPQYLRTSVENGGQYFRLMHRWFVFAQVLVTDQSVFTQLLLFVLLGLPPFLLWLSIISVLCGWWGVIALGSVLLIRHCIIRLLQRVVFAKLPGFSWWLSILAELLQPIHLLHALIQKTIRWRSRTIRVSGDGGFRYLSRGDS